MSDLVRLTEKLSKLRAKERVPGDVRKLKGASAPVLLAHVVNEIDEAILPRKLSFQVNGTTQIHLAVANRRLQAVLAPVPEVMGLDEIAGQPLPDIETPGVKTLGDALLTIFDGVSEITVSAARSDMVFPSDIGVPSNQLDRVWSLAEPEPDLPPDVLLGRFLGDLGDDAVAWLRIEGQRVAEQGGEKAAVSALGAQTARFLERYFSGFDAVFSEDASSYATLIAPSADEKLGAFFVETGQTSAMVSAEPVKLLKIASNWQRCLAN